MSKKKGENYDVQREEINILSSIYLTDMEFSKQTPPYKLTIHLKPFMEHWVTEDQESLSVQVDIEFTKSYPNEAPHVELHPKKTLMSKQNLASMNKMKDEIINTFKGIPMIFEIIESLRYWIQNNLVGPEMRPKKMRRKNLNDDLALDLGDEEEVIVNLTKKDTYTPCNLENFLLWKKKFDTEAAELKKLRNELVVEDNTKLTGRQLFEKNKALASSDLVAKQEDDEEEIDYTTREEIKDKDEGDGKDKLFCYDNDLFAGNDEDLFDPEDDA
jgi:hypothetical protein